MPNVAFQAGHDAKSTARAHRDKIQLGAKLGWAAKGGLYIILGLLAVMAAIGEGGAMTGSEGVIRWLSQQPFGQVLLVLAGVGFILYALWRVTQVIVDPERHDSKREMVAKRIGWGVSAALHAALAIAAFQMLGGGGGEGNSQQTWLAMLMNAGTWGVVLVGLAGVAAIAVGLFQFKKAADLAFMEDVSISQMSDTEVRAMKAVGRSGFAARGVVFPIIGTFLVKAAMSHNPAEAKGVGGALAELSQASWMLLLVIATGLVAYGVMHLFFARYRQVRFG